jgi:ribonuclease HII
MPETLASLPTGGGKDFWKAFPEPMAGVDEAGRGCLAGPVVAGAVILPPAYDLPGLTDSKKISAKTRQVLEKRIKEQALAWGLGLSWPPEIDRINILQASLTAMSRAVGTLRIAPAFLAVDGNHEIHLPLPQRAVVRGDTLVPAISAASILAKTFRDRLLFHLEKRYPGYGLAQHKGYGVKNHFEALRVLGPCPMHRLTFKGVCPETQAKEALLWLPGI